MSTVDCVFILNSIVSSVLNKGEKLYTAFIDFQKAFDRIPRSELWLKLLKNGVSNKFVKIVKLMYEEVKSRIRFDSRISDQIISHSGVKQGEPLSPIMFLFFVNDLSQYLSLDGESDIFCLNDLRISSLLYADDTVIFAKSPGALQHLLNKLYNYCSLFGVTC